MAKGKKIDGMVSDFLIRNVVGFLYDKVTKADKNLRRKIILADENAEHPIVAVDIT